MPIIGMNHAVLYVRDARVHERFYREVLGFEANIEDCDGKYVFMRAPGSSTHHDIAFFAVGQDASASLAGQASVGLYHLAWEVSTLGELAEGREELALQGCLGGASEHGVNKSLYAVDPDGLEFEVMWLVPSENWGEAETIAVVEQLDLAAEIARFGGDRGGGG